MEMNVVREVWSWNLDRELTNLQYLLTAFKFVSFDTEFPGCLRTTRRYASEETRFSDMRYNVNRAKLIQLGITISDDYWNVGGVWEFNFRDFDEESDDHAEASIALLKKNGIDFSRLRKEGIGMEDFGKRFVEILRPHRDLRWVTFHGLYDVGYLIKLLGRSEIPEQIEEFGALALKVLGYICDVKYIARFCEGLNGGEMGLEKMAKLLQVDRIGTAHCAGSDSLLTNSVLERITKTVDIPPELYDGFLYGLSFQILPVEQSFLVNNHGHYAPFTCVQLQ